MNIKVTIICNQCLTFFYYDYNGDISSQTRLNIFEVINCKLKGNVFHT